MTEAESRELDRRSAALVAGWRGENTCEVEAVVTTLFGMYDKAIEGRRNAKTTTPPPKAICDLLDAVWALEEVWPAAVEAARRKHYF